MFPFTSALFCGISLYLHLFHNLFTNPTDNVRVPEGRRFQPTDLCCTVPIKSVRMHPDLLQEACDVFLGAGGPGERGAVVHQLSGHDERVPPLQLAVIPLTVMMDSKAAVKYFFITHKNLSWSCSCSVAKVENDEDFQCVSTSAIFMANLTC